MATQQTGINREVQPRTAPAVEPQAGAGNGQAPPADGTVVRIEPVPYRGGGAEPAMSDLLKQLASEGGDLVRSELALAKLEMRDMARELAVDSAKVGAAIGIAASGALVLLAAVVIGLGIALGGGAGNYALSALIIGGVMLLVGALTARSGLAGLKNPPKPDQTVQSVQTTKDWASREAREFKEEIRTS
jgi:hypothetical protein